ncbi:hypothetical protein SAMN05216232_2027 [Virgibacillus subterraneus]|uniref:Uncharacterized protein n=2 Tax=Virgibacillus TaxID=84406 RepID=A0A1H1BQU3_9BACI|nr:MULTISPECIES: hypothetical protein [Virgibacillus]SDQ53756.1 hypothetical protein SAMN05216231_1845 [Virgibacillus salinus]SEQ24900.1 hypothetical protein SAMN05216232_2027 [Virgibacillus subterraneus]
MSKETKEYTDQANELRKLFNEVQEESEQSVPVDDGEDEGSETEQEERDVDILNLPPRKEVHSTNNKRTRVKLSGASLRLVIVVVIFLAFLGGAYYLWGQELMEVITNI